MITRVTFFFSTFWLLLPLANSLFAQQTVESGNIEVSIQGIDTEEEGKLIVLLFNSEDTWLEADQYYKMIETEVSNETEKIVFEDIPFGTDYAIEVIHDENGNLKMDMRILPYPKPKEGFGLSNNTFRAGPPEYEKDRFSLDQPVVVLNILMKY